MLCCVTVADSWERLHPRHHGIQCIWAACRRRSGRRRCTTTSVWTGQYSCLLLCRYAMRAPYIIYLIYLSYLSIYPIYSILFYSILFYSILFYSILFYSILFYFYLFLSI